MTQNISIRFFGDKFFATLGLALVFSAKLRIWQFPTFKMEQRRGYIATLGLHLGFSTKLRICQASACKMEPRSGIISCKNPTYQPTRHLSLEVLDISLYLIDLQLA